MALEMNGREAVFGFVSWLTCHKEQVTFGENCDAAPAAKLAEQFCNTNNLREFSCDWPGNLTYPKAD